MNATELLEKLVKAHDEWAKDREAAFRAIPTYDPFDGDQPCEDKFMGDYDEMEDIYAYHAQNTLTGFVEEVRRLLELESK
jgi:oligoribonuclease NrnB/cAMP/cGMP phosphodiesterase (DHH superfamily)